MSLRKGLVVVSVLLGMMGLASCGPAEDKTVYQYKETGVYYDDFKISKTVYTVGEMKLYYSGADFEDNRIRCYGADFAELEGEFEHSFQGGVLTIKADFAEQISGLMIDDAENGIIYHLRYLDSSQFAWLADELWLDDGWVEAGDKEKYYSAEELKEQAAELEAQKKETADTFALLEGTWVSEDNQEKLTFTIDSSGEHFTAELTWYDETDEEWVSDALYAEAAHILEHYDDDGEPTDLSEVILVNSDHSAADMQLVLDMHKHIIEFGGTRYHIGNMK